MLRVEVPTAVPNRHSYRARTAGRAHSECRPGFYWVELTADMPFEYVGAPTQDTYHRSLEFDSIKSFATDKWVICLIQRKDEHALTP